MNILIFDNQIAGRAEEDQDPDQLPSGFTLVKGPDLPLDKLYYHDGEVLVIPEPTSPLSIWQGTEWVEPAPVEPAIVPVPLHETELFKTAVAEADNSPAVMLQLQLALYADTKGLPDLLESALSALEDLLTV